MQYSTKMKKKLCDVFLILGIVWLIVGYLIYQNLPLLSFGFIFILIGLICQFSTKKSNDN